MKVGGRIVTLLAVLAGAAAAGYVVTLAIFPAPILPKAIMVPTMRGELADSAVSRLARLGLRGRLSDTVADPLTPAGTVAWQSPVAETMLPAGAVVRLGVSGGFPLVAMPDVADLDFHLARQVIEAAGLRVGRVDTMYQDEELGTVVATAPPSGNMAHAGDTVRVVVSGGARSIHVPDLVGLTVSAARERLAASGLRLGTLDQRFEGKAGTILAQRPAPGELVTKESGVDLTISGTIP